MQRIKPKKPEKKMTGDGKLVTQEEINQAMGEGHR